MPYAALGEFLAELQDNGEIARISVAVDSALELAGITDRVVKSSVNGGPAILFENVKNATIPVVTNLLGSRRRLCRCLGVTDLDEVSANLDRVLEHEHPGGWLDSLNLVTGRGGMNKYAPKTVKVAICQQIVRMGRDVNLWDLPIPRSWPEEEHPVITSGQVVIKHPGTGVCHYFQTPLVVAGPQQLAWYDGHRDIRSIVKFAVETNQNLQVAISLGGDPVQLIAASLPSLADVRLWTGILRNSPVEQVRCRSNELEVPAGSEIVIEGYIDCASSRSAEPLTVARSNGRYVRRQFPLIQVSAITHRANPVLPAMIAAPVPSEESWIGLAVDRLLLPLVKRLLPEIVDLHQPFGSANRNLLFVSIRKTADHQARRVMHALWGLDFLGMTKMIVVVDSDLHLRQEDQVWMAVGTNACPSRDFLMADGQARDDDYTPLSPSLSSRVGIDATRKLESERGEPWPHTLKMPDAVIAKIQERWADFQIE